MYLYRMIAKSEENPVERQLAELAAEAPHVLAEVIVDSFLMVVIFKAPRHAEK